MKKRLLVLFAFIQIITVTVHGQDEKEKFIYFDAGFYGMGCSAPDKDYIRAIKQNYDYYSDEIRALMMVNHFRLRYEYRVFSNKLGLSTGMQYSRIAASIGRDSYMSSGPDYFYLNYSNSAMSSEYARVTEISQKADYIGIPLELRFYPRVVRRFQYYYTAGFSFNLKVHSKTDISFYDESMDQYKVEVLEVVEKVAPRFTTFHFGIGIKVGNSDKPGIFIETYAPIGVRFPQGSYLVNPIAGGGIQVSLSVPLKTNVQ